MPQIRKHTTLPVGVGFGIRDGQTAKSVSSIADAVVIGSRIIEQMEAAPPDQRIAQATTFVAGIRKALDE
jgi:tryptophan synthase alpha chain